MKSHEAYLAYWKSYRQGPKRDEILRKQRLASKRRYQEHKDDPEYLVYSRTRSKLYQSSKNTEERKRTTARHYVSELSRKYGITLAIYEALVTKHGGLCAICKKSFVGKPNIDHDHKTLRVRGLLCTFCNQLLGRARDNVATLKQAIAYLEEHACI